MDCPLYNNKYWGESPTRPHELQTLEEKMYNPKTHHRKSIRLKEYDYSNEGWYYVTICTNNKEHLFGKVINNKIELNNYGKIVQEEWLKTKEVRDNVDLDDYVIMPNHFHGIIIITHNKNANVGATRWVAPDEEEVAPNKAVFNDSSKDNEPENPPGQQLIKENIAGHPIKEEHRAGHETNQEHRARHQSNQENRASHRLAPTIQSNSLGSIIGQFKSVCTKRIKLMLDYPITSIWQKNYYEHIIRNEDDLFRIQKYIAQNPLKWQLDEYY